MLFLYFLVMKKVILYLLSFALFVPGVMAATIVSDYPTFLEKNELRELAPVIITSTSDDDITAEHGINIVLPEDEWVLWNDTDLVITGVAKDNGKVNLNVTPQYASDYKSLYLPVMENFDAGDWLSIEGLQLRAYDDRVPEQALGLDLDGDLVPEISDINIFEVKNDERNDIVTPYPVTNVEYVIEANGDVTFSWNLPPDYDLDKVIVDRNRIKNGFSQVATVFYNFDTGFVDSDLDGVTMATYSITTRDVAGNQGSPVTVVIDFTAEEPVSEPEEEPVSEPEEEPAASETEVEELSRLLNYYNVRYSIKCMPSGVAVPDNDSACLWARIDLIYAQEMTGEEKVEGLALSERDLELMASRRRWPEMRYEDNCVAAQEPASYCSALGKALDRISYFLD